MQWKIDSAHTTASFSVKHMMITTVRGTFDNISGTLTWDPANRASASVEAQIEAATVNTGMPDRDNHLRSADFFNVEQHPYITFRSTAFTLKDEDHGVLVGELSIAGVTRTVELSVSFDGEGVNPWGMRVAGFTAETKINREDFGLTWNQVLEAGGVLVSKEVKITLDVQAALVTEGAAA
jgi:polyisoprenoid-binding protein YceI